MGKGPVTLILTCLAAGALAGPAALHGPPAWMAGPWAEVSGVLEATVPTVDPATLSGLFRSSPRKVVLAMPPRPAPRPPVPPRPRRAAADFSFTGIDFTPLEPRSLMSGTALHDALSSAYAPADSAPLPRDEARDTAAAPLIRVARPPRKPDVFVMPRSRLSTPPPPPSVPLAPVETKQLRHLPVRPEQAAGQDRTPTARAPST